MGLLEGKTALVVGIANDHSIAWGIAQALKREGADLIVTYQNEAYERRVRPLADKLGARTVLECDLGNDEAIGQFTEQLKNEVERLDIVVHSVAYAKTDELRGSFLNTSRDGFQVSLDVSAYTLTALVKAVQALLSEDASVVTMTYHGSQQVVPNYNIQGVAKAALEASVRYLAADLGPRGVRVNAISAGAIRTLASSAIAGIRDMIKAQADIVPLRRNVSIDDVGNAAVWLCSDWARNVTGQIIYVDAGASIVAVQPKE